MLFLEAFLIGLDDKPSAGQKMSSPSLTPLRDLGEVPSPKPKKNSRSARRKN